jgi:hypothetical protein
LSAPIQNVLLNTFDAEDAVCPGVIGEHGARLVHAARPHDEHGVLAVNVAYRPAERNLAVIAEPIDERGGPVPGGLPMAATRRVPVGPRACLKRNSSPTPTSHEPRRIGDELTVLPLQRAPETLRRAARVQERCSQPERRRLYPSAENRIWRGLQAPLGVGAAFPIA